MKKVIHLDNSEFFRKIVKAFLEKEGFEVENFENAHEADMVIVGGDFAMIIMGLTFADTAGEDYLKRTLGSFGGPVIVLSSSVDAETADRYVKMGAKAAIAKSGPWQEALKPHLSAIK